MVTFTYNNTRHYLTINECIIPSTNETVFMVQVRNDKNVVDRFFYDFLDGAQCKAESIYRWNTGKSLGFKHKSDANNPQHVFNKE